MANTPLEEELPGNSTTTPSMKIRWRRWALGACLLAVPLGLWVYDRSDESNSLVELWMDVTFHITDQQNKPVEGAVITIEPTILRRGETPIQLRTGEDGAASVSLWGAVGVWRQSRLGLSETHGAVPPRRRFKVLAVGYQPTALEALDDEQHRQSVQRYSGIGNPRLVIRVQLSHLAP
jgi:hypothetical protein